MNHTPIEEDRTLNQLNIEKHMGGKRNRVDMQKKGSINMDWILSSMSANNWEGVGESHG
jgi:hypothetical protein